jgi:hypothetical protein
MCSSLLLETPQRQNSEGFAAPQQRLSHAAREKIAGERSA